jgi:glycosyltransferase involved in cell wall biosynthesis
MRIALVTDAWFPQINGVVRTLSRVVEELRAMGHEVEVISPERFRTLPCPSYPEIRLAVLPGRKVRRWLDAFAPDAIQIATEGPLGLAARRYCVNRGLPFTSAYHTKFPEYIRARAPIPLAAGYRFMRWFHSASKGLMVSTATLQRDLEARGFVNVKRWTRGVDTKLFRPRDKDFLGFARPIFLYVGRVAVEKNIEAFLNLDLPGTKVVVGDGPARVALARRHTDTRFLGAKHGEELAQHYAAGDVFVFPSRTDTFGLVLLEALASGLPVAAYPVPGPLDVINGHDVGVLDDDLGAAAARALDIPSQRCRAFALEFSWRRSAEQFLDNLHPVD